MQTVTTIGLDIAKSVFQVHGLDAVLAFFEKLPPCAMAATLVGRLANNAATQGRCHGAWHSATAYTRSLRPAVCGFRRTAARRSPDMRCCP
jgi:hypothetical protein